MTISKRKPLKIHFEIFHPKRAAEILLSNRRAVCIQTERRNSRREKCSNTRTLAYEKKFD